MRTHLVILIYSILVNESVCNVRCSETKRTAARHCYRRHGKPVTTKGCNHVAQACKTRLKEVGEFTEDTKKIILNDWRVFSVEGHTCYSGKYLKGAS
jgi:hypothetical protein